MTPVPALRGDPAIRRQERIGLALAGAIGAGWLAIHVGGIFFWRWTPATIPLAAVLVLVQTWLSTGLFIVAHDAMHGALAPTRPRLNRAAGTVALALYAGLSYAALLPKHHLHHRHAGSADDPDFDHRHPSAMLPWFVHFFRGYYTHRQMLWITLAALAYTQLLGATMVNIVVFWAVPALLAVGQLFVFGTFLPHRHEEADFLDEHRARSMRVSPAVSLMTCFHFGGFHHEHHLKPRAAWWQLPGVRRETAGR